VRIALKSPPDKVAFTLPRRLEMSRSIIVLAGLFALTLIPTIAGAAMLVADNTKQFSVGGGNDVFSQLSWSAHSDVTGANVSGYFRTDNFENVAAVQGHVTCLTVVGNNSTIGFVIEKAKNLNPFDTNNYVGQRGYFFATDNGEPSGPMDDMVGSLPIFPGPALACPINPNPPTPLVQGNAVVRDATSTLLCTSTEVHNDVGTYTVDEDCNLYWSEPTH
jgi:hypothetical protein